MKKDSLIIQVRTYLQKVDWDLLVFLLLFLNVKLVVKILALVFMYARRFKRSGKFLPGKKGLSLFYFSMIAIALFNGIFFSLYKNTHYPFLLLTGTGFWIMCILALHQLQLAVNTQPIEKIHHTLLVFFLLNAAVSFSELFAIMIETGELNPYTYQGNYQKYFISTGDYIHGITFDTSTTNAMINAFGIVYFLSGKKMIMVLLCMATLLLTSSNFTNLLIAACLVYLFIARSDREQKSMIMVCIAMLVVFMVNVSPPNNKYTVNVFEKTLSRKHTNKQNTGPVIPVEKRPDSLLTATGKKYKIARLYLDSMALVKKMSSAFGRTNISQRAASVVEIPKANIHAPEYQHKKDSSEARLQALSYLRALQEKKQDSAQQAGNPLRSNPTRGKLIAYQQLIAFMQGHPSRWLTGNGIGNFSSKLAFRATGLKIAGGYPAAHTYLGKDFADNHLTVYLDYFGEDSGYHSITNSPNSFYGQLIGEYGLAGVLAFVFFYLRYFARSYKQLTYGIPLLLIMLAAFAVEYWFEQLSVVVLFELLLLLDLRSVRGEANHV